MSHYGLTHDTTIIVVAVNGGVMKFTHQMWHRKDFGYQNVCKHQISVDYR